MCFGLLVSACFGVRHRLYPFRYVLSHRLRVSSSLCAVIGGIMVASNTPVSGYGFLILALSSSQLCMAAWLAKDKVLTAYAASVFFFVDLLGVWRWLL